MRPKWSMLTAGSFTALLVVSLAFADELSAPPAMCGNGIPGGVSCIASKKDLKDAREAFKRGVKLHDRRQYDEALEQFDEAARLVPQNRDYLTAREVLTARMVFAHIQRGNALLMEDARIRAAAEFRAALDLDPENAFALNRLQESTQPLALPPATPAVARWENSQEIRL